MTRKIAIIGAGFGGLAVAYDLKRGGHDVEVFDAAGEVGGLAAGFKEEGWDWYVDRFYHHWFTSDHDMLGLIKELGLADRLVIPRPKTVVYYREKFYPLDSVLAALTFPGFRFFDMLRFGFVTAWLRYVARWQNLERFTAHEWMRKAYGARVYDTNFEPLLVGKFGEHYRDVTLAWFWARFKARSTRLVTFEGGFQEFANLFAEQIRAMGVQIHLNAPVSAIRRQGSGVSLSLVVKDRYFDQALVTTSPAQLARLAPELPEEYLQGLLSLKHMGAVVLAISLKEQLSREGYYWYNLPKSAGFPFLALVEHTNFVPASHFNGEHIVYCGDYLDPAHEYFSLDQQALLERFLPSLKRINPDFKPEWVNRAWLWKANYAQPVPQVEHSSRIPAIRTPMSGLFFASMSQVYPWDRGTNFAVQIARKAARMMLDA